ncbi:FeoC-like transcriptional regulator [Oceanithermus sp.]
MLHRLMVELARPQTTAQLAGRLGVERDVLEAMLRTLERKGYAGLAYPESPTCGASCHLCSLKNLCPAAGPNPATLPVWRLTALGQKVVEGAGNGR